MKFVDRTGQQYGRLLVLGRTTNSPAGATRWRCRCLCGTETIVLAGKLANGSTKSCGCYIQDFHTKHGQYQSVEYGCWEGIIQRCQNPKNKGFKNYGARGIRVCERWQEFENFLADIGPKPSPGHSLERINNDGNYAPENCRWATKPEQLRNTRRTVMVTIDGQLMCLKDACRLKGLNYNTAKKRRRSQWAVDEIFNVPVQSHS